jgi:hypothetical protein
MKVLGLEAAADKRVTSGPGPRLRDDRYDAMLTTLPRGGPLVCSGRAK